MKLQKQKNKIKGVKMGNERKELMVVTKEVGEKYLNELLIDVEEAKIDLRYPLYFECYKETLQAIFHKRHEETCLEKENVSPDNANNIIAFCGGRGSGKTTAINECGRILMNFNNNQKWWMRQLNQNGYIKCNQDTRVNFTVLDAIDASLLTEKEDVIEMILAQIYMLVDKKNKEGNYYEREMELVSKITRNFDQIYKNYHKLSRGEKKMELGESVAVMLKNVATGPKFRQAFGELLTNFFCLMYGDGENLNQYIVVIIDDLDLNISNGYEILEQIHKYLSDLRIIVLIAIDFEQLSKICCSCFEEKYRKKQLECDEILNLKEETMQLSKDYLLKAIPIYNRIYMPDKRSFEHAVFIKGSSDDISVKDYIMAKIFSKVGILYDLAGSKRHFAVPTTVRELVNYDDFLNSLYDIDWNDTKIQMIYRYNQNHVRMNKDIINRMAPQLLNLRQLEVFKRLTDKNILQRPQYTIEIIQNWMKREKGEQIDNKTYRYGDLLEALYTLGRNDYEDKVLVHCILAFFTSEMTKEYYNLIYNENNESEKRLRSLLGNSFGNEWLGEMLPGVNIRSENRMQAYKVGFTKEALLNHVELKFIIKGINIGQNSSNRNGRIEEVLCGEEIIRCIDIFLNFICTEITDGYESTPKISFKYESKRNSSYYCTVSFQASNAAFDILGFIVKKNSMAEKEILAKKIIHGILEGYNAFIGTNHILDVGRMKNKIMDVFNQTAESNVCVFPYYNLDLAYNVLKRARKAYMQSERFIAREKLCNAIRKAYGYIAVELRKEDEKSRIEGTGLWERFVQAKHIQYFGIIYPEKEKKMFDLSDIDGKIKDNEDELIRAMISLSEVIRVENNDDSLRAANEDALE